MTQAGLADAAARVWADRRQAAMQLIARGQWSQQQADREANPFLIACVLCWIDARHLSPDVRAELAALRMATTYPGAREVQLPDADMRELFATLHAAPGWRAELGAAAARARHRCTDDPSDQARTRYRDLATLCRALDVAIPLLPIEQKSAAQDAETERKAA